MSKPPFVMSKYMNELDLYKDKAKYYQEKSERLSKELAANPMGSISARPLKQEDQSALFGSTLDNEGE